MLEQSAIHVRSVAISAWVRTLPSLSMADNISNVMRKPFVCVLGLASNMNAEDRLEPEAGTNKIVEDGFCHKRI